MQTPETFFTTWSDELAYVLGFFAADGNLSINKKGGHYISFQSKDFQIIKDIKNSIGSKNKISKRKNPLSEGCWYRLQIGSKSIVVTLMTMGFSTKKTGHLPLPKIPKEFFPDFIRGYFDGDGNIWQGLVHKERKTSHLVLQLAFTSASIPFLLSLQNTLTIRLDTHGSIVRSKNATYGRLQYSTGDALKIYNFMYNTNASGLCLRRKKKQYTASIAAVAQR